MDEDTDSIELFISRLTQKEQQAIDITASSLQPEYLGPAFLSNFEAFKAHGEEALLVPVLTGEIATGAILSEADLS